MNRSLVDNERSVKVLARLVWEKGKRCCVCEDENVSIWIFDAAHVANGCLVFGRLLCRDHESLWKKGEKLNYRNFNGVMLLELPYPKPLTQARGVGMWANMSLKEFRELAEAHSRNDRYRLEVVRETSFEEYLTKNVHLIFKGDIQDFIKNL